MKSVDELWGLLREARGLPYGAAQIALVEQVLRHADAAGDRQLAFATRMVATTAYVYGGEVAKSFVTFSWCVSDFDRDPAPHHQRFLRELLWHFKYMANALTDFPEVPLDRTRAVLDDMERRYRDGGFSLQAVYKHRFQVARHVGDADAAAHWYERWQTTPRDELSDCAGCDPSATVRYLVSQGRDEDAVALAEPVLAGRLTCVEQPQQMLTELLVPYVRTGRLDPAVDAHRRAYRALRGNLADLQSIGEHIEFCARTGNGTRGLEILQRHLEWLDRAPSPGAAMQFAASAALLLRRLTADGFGDVPVHRREYGERPAADVPAARLADDLARYATDLAARFDARNGTTEQSTWIGRLLVAEPFGPTLPLSPSARPVAASPPPAGGPSFPTIVADVPAEADPATLLELAESYRRADADEAAEQVLAAFDERFGDSPLPALVAARREDFRGGEHWAHRDAPAALAAWERAAAGFAAAGDADAASRAAATAGVARCLLGEVDTGLPAIAADAAHQDRHGGPRERSAAHSRLAVALSVADRPDEAVAALAAAGAAADESGDPRLVARHALRAAQVLRGVHRHEQAREAAQRAREFYRAEGPASEFAAAGLAVARASTDPADALAATAEVVGVAVRTDRVEVLVTRARALVALERPAEAVHDFVEAVALCAELDLAEYGAALRHELAIAYRDADRLVEAAEVAEEAVTALSRCGMAEAADDAKFVLAGVYGRLDAVDDALAQYDELVASLTERDNRAGRAQVTEQAAELLFRADRDAEAARRFGAAADDYAACDDIGGELRALRRRVTALHWADDVAAGEDTLRRALSRHDELPAEIASQPAAIWERGMLCYEAGRLLTARDRAGEAVAYLDGVPERMRGIGADQEAGAVDVMLAEALLGAGRADAAVPRLERLLAGSPAGSREPADSRQRLDPRQQADAARLLADAHTACGAPDRAAAVRAEHGLAPGEPA